MGWLINLFGSGLVGMLGDAIVKPVIAAIAQKRDSELEKFKAATGAERDALIAALQAETAANEQKRALRAQAGRFGPTLLAGLLLFAVPTGLHYWAVVLDSVCGMWSDPACVGSWKVATLGNLHATEQVIIQSFFIVGGGVAVATIAGRILRR